MLEYKKRIIAKEFPFLSEVFDCMTKDYIGINWTLESMDEISIKKCDDNFFLQKGRLSYSYYDEFCRSGESESEDGNLFFAVIKDGENFKVVEIPGMKERHSRDSDFYSDEQSQTVGEELLKFNIFPEFIIQVKISFSDHKGYPVERNNSLIITKLKNFDLAGYHQNKFEKAAKEIMAEIIAASN